MKRLISSALLLTSLISGLGVAEPQAPIDYPDNYRHWTHVKSMVIEPGHPLANPFQGIHHIYANNKALEGYKQGHFKDGAIIVFDLLHYQTGGDALTEGERKLIGVMVKDLDSYRETGGWGFEAFAGNSRENRLVDDGGMGCFGCHTAQKQANYVFSKFRR